MYRNEIKITFTKQSSLQKELLVQNVLWDQLFKTNLLKCYGGNNMKPFGIVIYTRMLQATAFVTNTHSYPSLIFVSKTKANMIVQI